MRQYEIDKMRLRPHSPLSDGLAAWRTLILEALVQLSGCKRRTRLGARVDQGDKRGTLPDGVRRGGLPRAHRKIFRSDVQEATAKGGPQVVGRIDVKPLAFHKDVFEGGAVYNSPSVQLLIDATLNEIVRYGPLGSMTLRVCRHSSYRMSCASQPLSTAI